MPIIDHIEKIVVPNAVGDVTFPFAYNPGALNRSMLVIIMVQHPFNSFPLDTVANPVTYAGQVLDQNLFGQSTGEGGGSTPVVSCLAFNRTSFLVEAALSGNIIIPSVLFPANLIAYAVGMRGVPQAFDQRWDFAQGNSIPSSAFAVSMNNPFVGIIGAAIKDEATISSVSGTAAVAEQEVISDGVHSLTGSVVLVDAGQNVTTCFLTGNAGSGRVGWVPNVYVDQGVDIGGGAIVHAGGQLAASARAAGGPLSMRGLVRQGGYAQLIAAEAASARARLLGLSSAGPLRATGPVVSRAQQQLAGSLTTEELVTKSASASLLESVQAAGSVAVRASAELHDESEAT